MAIPIALNDILQVTIEGTNERHPWAWVSHYKVDAVSDPATHVDTLRAYMVQLLGDLAANLTDEWVAECMKVARVAPSPMGITFLDDGFPIPGTITTDGIPNQSAGVVRFGTDETGPSNRGRMYLNGIPEASTNGGQIRQVPADAIDGSLATNWLGGYDVVTDIGTPVVFSRTLYGTDPPGHPANVGDYVSLITSVHIQRNLGVIRNRRYPRNVAGA